MAESNSTGATPIEEPGAKIETGENGDPTLEEALALFGRRRMSPNQPRFAKFHSPASAGFLSIGYGFFLSRNRKRNPAGGFTGS